MIDALLFAVRDGIRAQNFGYSSAALCEIVGIDGKPPQRMGNIFVGVHESRTRNTSTRNLDEYFDWSLTLTMRVDTSITRDRMDDFLASKLARIAGPRNPSFNARLEQLRAWGHENWQVTVQTSQTPFSANDYLLSMTPASVPTVYGFVEPAHYAGMEPPGFVFGDWFGADPGSQDVGIKSELRFVDARRMQAQTAAVGPNV